MESQDTAPDPERDGREVRCLGAGATAHLPQVAAPRPSWHGGAEPTPTPIGAMTFIGKIATFRLRRSPAGPGLALHVKDFRASSVEQQRHRDRATDAFLLDQLDLYTGPVELALVGQADGGQAAAADHGSTGEGLPGQRFRTSPTRSADTSFAKHIDATVLELRGLAGRRQSALDRSVWTRTRSFRVTMMSRLIYWTHA
jgi:hypothetical protein